MFSSNQILRYKLREVVGRVRANSGVFFICLFLHCSVAGLYNLFIEQTEIITYFSRDFNASLFFLQILSFINIVVKKKLQHIFIFVLKLLTIIIIGIPLGDNIYIEVLLYTTIVIESAFFLSAIGFFLLSILSSLLIAFFQKPYTVWFFTEVSSSPIETIFFFSVYSIFIIVMLGLLKKRTERLFFLEGRNNNLSDTVSNLIQANKGFQEYAVLAKEKAESEERKRISREIHDTVGYTFTNLIVMMESATDFSKVNPAKTNQLLENARHQAEKGFEEIRYSLRLLRKIGNRRLCGISALQELIKTFRNSTGIDITIEYGNFPWSVGEELDEIIYHIIQEGMINSFRHGHGTEIRILLWIVNGEINLSITDNGTGSVSVHEGIGIAGMKESLLSVGGRIHINNVEKGFQLSAEIPFPKKNIKKDYERN